tara:strand:+ start:5825 stop:6967 length:1143 start_codon:yes stop_codon:yes gene_type:complete
MSYCSKCIIPITRPETFFNENICNACISYEQRKNIDWKKRWKIFIEKIEEIKKKKASGWNCIIPSSGGKDSTYQALKARELGLNPVIVTAATCHLSDIGRKNIDNLKFIGFDTVEITPNFKTRAKLNRISLEEIGDISWPEHIAIFTFPIKFALKNKIPLILYGENPQVEYGGPEEQSKNQVLDRKWLEEFGGLIGLRVSDFIENHNFSKNEMDIYKYPTEKELSEFKIESLFLGFFEQWDSLRNAEVAKKNGFTVFSSAVENGYLDSEKIDNYQHGIHDYFKYLKYGFGRATDQISYLIRRGKLTRDQGIKLIKDYEGNFPNSYLGKPLKEILDHIEISIDHFQNICDKYTNKKIFKCDQNGNLIKDSKGKLINTLKYY